MTAQLGHASLTRSSASPRVSVVIPVHNEEGLLRSAVLGLRAGLERHAWSYEILLAENGSRDRTVEIAQDLAREFREVSVFSIGTPNYGLALREGILRARGRYVICEEIDLCDERFHGGAMGLLESGVAEMVVGSKAMRGALDTRPLLRRTATRVINLLLRWCVGFKGTDTHGLKAFRRSQFVPIVLQCVIEKDLFASEFVIRSERAGRRIVEIPIDVEEKRPPSIDLTRRVPGALVGIARLIWAVRFRNGAVPARQLLPKGE